MLRFFLPLDNAALIVGDAGAELVDLAHGNDHHGDGDIGLFLPMELEQVVQSHPVDVVAGEDDDLF